MKKKVVITSIILVLIGLIIFSAISLAGNEVLFVGLNATYKNGNGYGMLNPLETGGTRIWDLRNYDSTDRNKESSIQKELYCLKGLYGDSWYPDTSKIVEYNLSYNLQTEREKALQLLNSGTGTANEVVKKIINDSTGVYKELLWIIDNLYIEDQSERIELLKRIGIINNPDAGGEYDEPLYIYEPKDGYDYSSVVSKKEYDYLLTNEDIMAVQQAVIWYFTNAKVDGNEMFNKKDKAGWMTLTTDGGNTYNYLSTTEQVGFEDGRDRDCQVAILYNYLIDSAIKNANKYTSTGYKKPVEVNLTGLTDIDGKYEIESIRKGNNYITGPIKITKNNELNYNMELKITNAKNGVEIKPSNYVFTDANGTSLGITDIKTLAGRTDGFYISVSKDIAKGINIDVKVEYNTKTKRLWLAGTENGTTSITVNSEQPVLELTNEPQTDNVSFTATPKEFDLALRKYIIQRNGVDVTNTRVPNISEDTLQNGTTATYKHRKDPVVVENGDIVTYKITIYNEGEKKGYASEITDQLPTGLKYIGGSTITSNKNTYNVTYNSSTNKVTFVATTSTALNEYVANSLDNETLEFTCEVTATPDTANDKILTNVAWISKAYDTESKIEIIEIGDDRDSRPQTSPNVNKDNMENYKGNALNKNDLTDSTYHYTGEQDDDDFEKLVIEPVTEITVEKTWEDNNDQDGLRQKITSVNVNLLANNKVIDNANLTKNNSWTHTFTNLPLKENGTAITYSVEEVSDIDGYETSIEGFTIKNIHEPDKIKIPVEKIWIDGDNQDNTRPTSIRVDLMKGTEVVDTVILNEENEWKHTFENLPKNEAGNPIIYTVKESGVDESVYKSEITENIKGDITAGYTITNTYEPKTTEISVEKVWDDFNNQDGIRPPEITVTLLANGIPVDGQTITLNDSNSWKHIFTNLPEYSKGNKIIYTVSEPELPKGYAKKITGDMTNGFVIINTHKLFDLALRKYITKINGTALTSANTRVPVIFEDTLQSGTTATYNHRKDPVKVETGNIVTYQITVYNEGQKTGYASQIIDQLPTGLKYAGATTITSKTLSGANKNTYNVTYDENSNKLTFDITGTPKDLEAYIAGKLDREILEIQCQVVADPETTNEIILTNVAWISGAYDTEDDTPAPTDRDSQPETTPDVDKDNMEDYKGNEENSSDLTNPDYHYKGEQDDDDFEKLVIKPESVNVPVTKVWDDGNDQDRIRPKEITVQLFANGTIIDGKTAILNEANSWKYTFKNLPKKTNGVDINYTVEETEDLNDYISNITGDMTNGFIITNSYTPEEIDIPIEKVWDDGNDQDGKRPTEITITLYANGAEVEGKTVILNKENGWKYTFTKLPKNENGTPIDYTVKETGMLGDYTPNIEKKAENGFTITNKRDLDTIDIPVEKIWNDGNNQDGTRPTEITVTLYANGVEVKTVTLNEGNEWKHTFEKLQKNEKGTPIKYTVQEGSLPEGYTSLITGSMATGFTITNSYTPGETSVKVTKVWEDNNNQDGIRPDSVSVSLIKNGDKENPVKTVELNEDNGWEYTFTKLPLYSNGDPIIYTIVENTKIDGYETTITNNNVSSTPGEITTTSASEYVITNTHETDEISITVNKIWNDENNADKIRPTSVVVNIKNGEKIVATVTLSEENNWTHIFKNLPAKENGIDINYVIEEVEPDGYTAEITEDSPYNYTIKNTHIPTKVFDLALRKYITKINNNNLTTLGLASRVPNISELTLQNGTTATYKHRKDPVKVEEGDIVTYQITIFNEGEKAGYASQIIDQLPTGLIYNPSSTVTSVDAEGAEKNTYQVTYEASTNKVTFNIINTEENPAKELQPYSTNSLDSETIEIKCKVVYRAIAGEKNILTNVAWINEAYNTTDDKQAINVGEDRDSEPGTKPNVNKDNMEDYKGNTSNKNDLTDSTYHYEGEQDDDDFEKLYVKTFDLSLRKFITSVDGKELKDSDGKYTREPVVDTTGLKNGTSTTAIYNHPKAPVSLKGGDKVIYTIRVYNEGEVAGYANEVKDYLPPFLTYVENSTINKKYGWQISEDGRIATTTYLANKEISEFNGTSLDYEDLQIECIISTNATPDESITNIAEISEYKYGDTVVPEDIDSESDNIDENLPKDKDLPNYKEDEQDKPYVPGNEDDDDFEKVYVKEFDLALRKFITEVQEKTVTTREPQVKNENGKISYEHPKDPITLHAQDVVIYTLRIYNEGEIAGYASEISDDIPEYLEYLPDESTNVEYMWKMYDKDGNETTNVDEAVKVKTTYLSKENGEDNLLEAFDGNTLYYRDIKIAFKVKDPGSNTYIITNHAQISDDTDENGNEIKDKDSEPDEWNDGEDDQDIENVKVEYFDLSILKFVSKVIIQEDGQEKITETGYNGHEDPEPVVKVELHKKKLDNVVVKFGYGMTVTNEGDVPGYATELTDYIPEGLKFEVADNPLWKDEGNNVISTRQLENTLLQPGESATAEVLLTWINGAENLALKTNIVEISDDKNEYDVPDRDSTPDNKKDGEDDIDIAKVILAISTGSGKTYFMLTIGLLAVVGVGIVFIKKFVI